MRTRGIRQRATSMGGDGIVGIAQAEHASSGQSQVTTAVLDSGMVTSTATFSVGQTTVLSGTVIRFSQPGCRS